MLRTKILYSEFFSENSNFMSFLPSWQIKMIKILTQKEAVRIVQNLKNTRKIYHILTENNNTDTEKFQSNFSVW